MTLYCVTHKPITDFSVEKIHLIQVGQGDSDFSDIRDNQGDNISSRNSTFSELTAFYQVWRNRRSDYVGFCHYRRFFIPPGLDQWAANSLTKPYEAAPVGYTGEGNYASCYSANSNQVEQILSHSSVTSDDWYHLALASNDIILPKSNLLPEGDMIYQYGTSHPLNPMFALLQLMSEKDHYLGKAAYEYFRSAETAHWNNLFITRWSIFSDYCEFLFELLFELEKRIETPLCQYQRRVFAFLSERLLNFWVWYQSLKVAESSWCVTGQKNENIETHQKDPDNHVSYNADWRLKRAVP